MLDGESLIIAANLSTGHEKQDSTFCCRGSNRNIAWVWYRVSGAVPLEPPLLTVRAT